MSARPATAATSVRNLAPRGRGTGAPGPTRASALASAATLALALCLAAALGPRDAAAATARVQYVSAASVYLDAGRSVGLSEGARVTVTRNGKEIARLTVVFVAEHSTACRVESSTDAIRTGDVATFAAAATQDSSEAAAVGSAADSSSAAAAGGTPAAGTGGRTTRTAGDLWPSTSHVHGRITSFYTRTSDPNGTYENPSLFGDLRWAGRGLEQAALRLRATRPSIRATTDLPGTETRESTLRIYDVTAGYRTRGGKLEAETGRILPRRLEGIGYTDGAAIFWRLRPTLAMGLTGGRSANLATAGFASRGLQLSGYLEMGSPVGLATRRWHATVGAAFSSASALTRRSYVSQHVDYTPGAGTSFYQSAEVDLNPRWKREYGEPTVALTAWSLGCNFWMNRRISLAVGADSRRAVLLPEQRLAPAPITLDRFTGAHASSRVGLPRNCAIRVGGDIRRRERDGEIFSSWDGGLTGGRIGIKELSGGLHVMGYSADHLRGVNGDANLSARFGPWSQLDLSGGLGETSTDLAATPAPPYRSRWLRAGIDYRSPGGRWATLAHEWRGGGPGNELAAELGFSF